MLNKEQSRIIRIFTIVSVILASFISGFQYSTRYDYPVYRTNDIPMAEQALAEGTEDASEEDNSEPTLEDIMDIESMWIAKLLQGIDSNSDDDKRTYGMCTVLRAVKYHVSIESVVNKPSQWVNYNPDVTVTQKNYDIAVELVNIYHSNILPVGTEFEFAEWSPTKVVLKNDFEHPTKTWWWGKVM